MADKTRRVVEVPPDSDEYEIVLVKKNSSHPAPSYQKKGDNSLSEFAYIGLFFAPLFVQAFFHWLFSPQQ